MIRLPKFQRSRTVRQLYYLLPFFLITAPGLAQQDPAYALYMWNMLPVNPAYAGTNDRMNTTLLGRQQWVGLEGAPSTQALSIHAPIADQKMAVGGSAVRDKVGPLTDLRASVDLAYRIRTSGRMRLAFGLKAGVEWMQLKLSEVPNVEANDAAFQQDQRSGARPICGFGTYWWSNTGFIAFHMPRLLEYNAFKATTNGQLLMEQRQQRTYMLTAGRVFSLNEDLKVQGWAMLKATLHAPASFDISTSLVVRDQLWVGLSRHGTGALAALLAYRFADRIQVAYAYGASMGGLRAWNDGTHEIMLTYDVPTHIDRTLSPRYF